MRESDSFIVVAEKNGEEGSVDGGSLCGEFRFRKGLVTLDLDALGSWVKYFG